MKMTLCAFVALGLLFFIHPVANADMGEGLLRQGMDLFGNTERNKSAINNDGEVRKQSIEADAQYQINRLSALIAENERRISEELRPELLRLDRELRILKDEHQHEQISDTTYTNKKVQITNRINAINTEVKWRRNENMEFSKTQKQIRTDADAGKARADSEVSKSVEGANKNRNKEFFDKAINGLKH